MKRALFVVVTVTAWLCVCAQTETRPVYIVNNIERDDVRDIPESNIESVEMLPSDDLSVAKYGERANNGIVVIRLKYDTAASFLSDTSFEQYVVGHTKWDPRLPVARFVARYTVKENGMLELGDILVSTDSRLEHRIRDVIKGAPGWKPAMRDGKCVESSYVLQVQLPLGKAMPREPYIVIR